MAAPNRLAREKSPYLLSHARNPVDWYPWGEEAFAAARARDVPLFVSIGYSACHWCHVMERECFEDAEVARLMNEHLVAVKVDREELPAVDHLFMAFCQGMTGSGGWPLTVVLTPAGKPFFAGTYFPKESGFGRPGMMELAPLLGRLWRDEREKVLATAEQLERALAAQVRPRGRRRCRGARSSTRSRASSRVSTTRAGAVSAARRSSRPCRGCSSCCGTPSATAGTGAPASWSRRRCARCGSAASATTLGYGFHRYSTDAGWLVPHFEKMLYDQALLALAYTEAFRLWGDAAFRGHRRRRSSRTCCATCGRRTAGSPPRRTPTARARRGGSISGASTR